MRPAPGAFCETEDGATPGPTPALAGSGWAPAGLAGLGLARTGWENAGFAWIVMPRHGRRPLAVRARALLRADNRCAALPCWSEIVIHETAAGRFAVSLCHISPTAGPPWRDAFLCAGPEAVRAVFRAHDPLWALPAGLRQFRRAWAGLLRAVFGLERGVAPP